MLEEVRQITIRAFEKNLLQGIVKVRSHENLDAYDDIVQQWAIRGNEAADKCAAQARQHYGSEFFAVWQALARDLNEQTAFCNSIHGHFVRVGMTSVQEKGKIRKEVEQQWAYHNGETLANEDGDDIQTSWATVAQKTPVVSEDFFGDIGSSVIQWLQGLTSMPDAELQWVTFYQLLVDFQLNGGQYGVKYVVADKRWYALTEWEVSQVFEFTRTAQWFGAYLRTLAKTLSESCEMRSQRPTSSSFARWNKCVRMPVSKRRMLAVDRLWQGHGILPIKHVTSAFKGRVFAVLRST